MIEVISSLRDALDSCVLVAFICHLFLAKATLDSMDTFTHIYISNLSISRLVARNLICSHSWRCAHRFVETVPTHSKDDRKFVCCYQSELDNPRENPASTVTHDVEAVQSPFSVKLKTELAHGLEQEKVHSIGPQIIIVSMCFEIFSNYLLSSPGLY